MCVYGGGGAFFLRRLKSGTGLEFSLLGDFIYVDTSYLIQFVQGL